ncbi:hypothetical protein BGY98DRAFT_938220 [Russula aff. rugulosa BPL654]|nr:hypothetical protein BGY98DRAFT_938220 [Russula aff. rugulosa BPL654]
MAFTPRRTRRLTETRGALLQQTLPRTRGRCCLAHSNGSEPRPSRSVGTARSDALQTLRAPPGLVPFWFGVPLLHDYLRVATRGSSPTTNPSSLASSTCSSLRSSPVPSGRYQPAFIAQAPALRAPHHTFTPAPLAGRHTSRFDWATPI